MKFQNLKVRKAVSDHLGLCYLLRRQKKWVLEDLHEWSRKKKKIDLSEVGRGSMFTDQSSDILQVASQCEINANQPLNNFSNNFQIHTCFIISFFVSRFGLLICFVQCSRRENDSLETTLLPFLFTSKDQKITFLYFTYGGFECACYCCVTKPILSHCVFLCSFLSREICLVSLSVFKFSLFKWIQIGLD